MSSANVSDNAAAAPVPAAPENSNNNAYPPTGSQFKTTIEKDREIVKEGFLVKKGHVRRNWKTRWCVLSNYSLKYFKRQKVNLLLSLLNLS